MLARLALAALVLAPLASSAQPSADVPVKRVILFTSGVGYFEHDGTVQGDADLTLRFEQSALDDVIKSLVVEDARGRVSEVVYPSQAPLARRLQAFAVDLSRVGGIESLLGQMRGAVLQVETPGGTFLGPLASVDSPTGGESDPGTRITLLTAGGLRTLPLAEARRVEIVDADLRAEVQGALAALAEGTSGERKPVTVRFRGARQRPVRLGYVVESPVWKTTYRLVLPARGEREAYMQGWAVVENPTESDWDDVRLELVSGRPISFEMDLYSPRYLQRPTVQLPNEAAGVVPRTYADGVRGGGSTVSVRPGGRAGVIEGTVRDAATGEPLAGANVLLMQTDRGAATDLDGRFRLTGVPTSGDRVLAVSYVGYETARQNVTLASGAGLTVDARLMPSGTLDEVTVEYERPLIQNDAIGVAKVVTGADQANLPVRSARGVANLQGGVVAQAALAPAPEPLAIGAGVQSNAQAGSLGELFAYVLDGISIPRRGSAMLPIVTEQVASERLSIFTPGAAGRHPLRGARIRNTTDKHLRGGPITVFDDGYAGDAILNDLGPGDDRLVTYAVDQDMLVDPVDSKEETGEVDLGTITDGILTLRKQRVRQTGYRAENRGERQRALLIEHPRMSGGELTGGLEAEETAPGLYRLRLEVAPGEADTLVVREAATVSETYRILALSPSTLQVFARSTAGLSPEVKRLLERAADLAREAAQATSRVSELERERNEISREQDRIRQNLQAVDSNTDYGRRLLTKLNEQEDRLEELDREIDAARQEAQERRAAFERGVAAMRAE